ncbi:MAG: ParB/RepB/Spo0J family partition protein [Halobacteriales archaeon]|nr:ParB/RepB/Spo0J family partition protein [Halobacteriales archaeon]
MKIKLSKINTDLYDVRDEVEEEHVDDIAESLEEDGQWNPIIVRPSNHEDGYDLIAGHTRYRAAKKLGWDELEATVKDVDDEEANELALKTNLKRKGMSKIEEGKVINDLLQKHDLTRQELADKLGKSQRWVSERIKVALELDPKVKGLVQEGELSYNIARIVTQVEEKKQLEFAELLVDQDITDAAEATKLKSRFQNDTIYTIGYEGRNFEGLVDTLQENEIEILIDIRESGESTYKPEFNSDVLSDRLPENDIEYLHEPELGVNWAIRRPYKDGAIGHNCFEGWYNWWISEEADIDIEEFADEIEQKGSAALMCIEKYAEANDNQDITCHRHHLSNILQDVEENGRQLFPNRKDL